MSIELPCHCSKPQTCPLPMPSSWCQQSSWPLGRSQTWLPCVPHAPSQSGRWCRCAWSYLGAKMSKRWLTHYINKMWSRGLGHIPSCQQRSPLNVLHSQCLDASCQRLHPVGIEPMPSCHASLTRLHILLMYWVNHLLDILAPRCPKGDWPNTLTDRFPRSSLPSNVASPPAVPTFKVPSPCSFPPTSATFPSYHWFKHTSLASPKNGRWSVRCNISFSFSYNDVALTMLLLCSIQAPCEGKVKQAGPDKRTLSQATVNRQTVTWSKRTQVKTKAPPVKVLLMVLKGGRRVQ